MTTINDLEDRIKDAEAVLEMLKSDLEAIKEQEKEKQPEPESLFGRWATHPNFGRGIITNDHPEDGKVWIHTRCKEGFGGSRYYYVDIDKLTINPAVLTTVEDYEQAPIGTIIVGESAGNIACKLSKSTWKGIGAATPWFNDELAERDATRVIRWGTGA